MNKNTAIKVTNLSKVYKLYDKPADRLKEALNPLRTSYHKEFYALDNINFEIKKGETVGIIGKNGAGKSTLLKIITGVLTPSAGHVQVNGRIASLLELGAGFNPEYTGVENIYLQGTLMGYTKEEMESKIQAVLDFADIGDFVYQPVKSYSSGMFARLAFAVAINVDPDILIVDEALSVGDMRFQQKCFLKMRKLREKNITILLVSHDMNSLRKFTDSCIWIDKGICNMLGETEDVVNAFISYMMYEKSKSNVINIEKNITTHENNWKKVALENYDIKDGVSILGVSLEINNNLKNESIINEYNGNERVIYKVKVLFEKDVENLMIGIAIIDKNAIVICHLNTNLLYHGSDIQIKKNEEYIFSFEFTLPNLAKGYYSFYTNIVDGNYSLNNSLALVN